MRSRGTGSLRHLTIRVRDRVRVRVGVRVGVRYPSGLVISSRGASTPIVSPNSPPILQNHETSLRKHIPTLAHLADRLRHPALVLGLTLTLDPSRAVACVVAGPDPRPSHNTSHSTRCTMHWNLE